MPDEIDRIARQLARKPPPDTMSIEEFRRLHGIAPGGQKGAYNRKSALDAPSHQQAGEAALRLTLPYPPSINHYWRHSRGKTHISTEGKRFRELTAFAVAERGRQKPFKGALKVTIIVHPPDKRRRDLDNILKALLDALEHAGVYDDDRQISALHVIRAGVERPGSVEVSIAPL